MHFDQKHYKAADAIAKLGPGESLKGAMMSAGYSESTANGGWDAVPKRVMKLLTKKGLKLKELGEIDPQTQEKITRGRLVMNVIQGTDKGAMSARILGSDKRISMWQPDLQAGVIVIQAPTVISENKNKLLEEPTDSQE